MPKATVQKQSIITDEEGIQTKQWSNLVDIYPLVRNINGNEFFKAAAINSRASKLMTFRYCPNIDTSCRVVYNGENYNILYLDNIRDKNMTIEMLLEVVE